MDAKTAVKWLRPGFHKMEHYQDDANNVADFIEQQEKYAELGRLAVQGLSQELSVWHCHGNFDSDLCKWYCNGHGCEHQEFCKKRAELLAEVPK